MRIPILCWLLRDTQTGIHVCQAIYTKSVYSTDGTVHITIVYHISPEHYTRVKQ